MRLTKIEKKMLAKYKSVRVSDCSNAGFILSGGFIILTTNHAALCRTIGYNLPKVIQAGICRFLSCGDREGRVIAFEYCILTDEQKNVIRRLLKVDDYFCVITTKTVVSRFKPIRSIQF